MKGKNGSMEELLSFIEEDYRLYKSRKKQVEKGKSRIEEIEEEIEESINNPARQERRKRRINWQVHQQLLYISETASLKWSCSSHSNMSMDEASKLAKENYESTFDENFEDEFNP